MGVNEDIQNYYDGLVYIPGLMFKTIIEYYGDVDPDSAVINTYRDRYELREIYIKNLFWNRIKKWCNKWLLMDFEVE